MFTEDLSLFLADFGQSGTLAGAPVRVIYSDPAETDLGIRAAGPQAEIPTAQVPAQSFGAQLVIPQGTFTVREALPDGTGMTLLLLQRVAGA